MELEERITKLEAVVVRTQKLTTWEYTIFKTATFILFVLAVIAFLVWASSELISFAVERFFHVVHVLGF